MGTVQSRRTAVALVATAVIVIGAWWFDDDPAKTLPDRDTTRLERVTDLQLPTL